MASSTGRWADEARKRFEGRIGVGAGTKVSLPLRRAPKGSTGDCTPVVRGGVSKPGLDLRPERDAKGDS